MTNPRRCCATAGGTRIEKLTGRAKLQAAIRTLVALPVDVRRPNPCHQFQSVTLTYHKNLLPSRSSRIQTGNKPNDLPKRSHAFLSTALIRSKGGRGWVCDRRSFLRRECKQPRLIQIAVPQEKPGALVIAKHVSKQSFYY